MFVYGVGDNQHLNVGELTSKLLANKSITADQLVHIVEGETPEEKHNRLAQVIQSGTLAEYDIFVKCLSDLNPNLASQLQRKSSENPGN